MIDERVIALNRRAIELARKYPANYHKLPEYQEIVDLRRELMESKEVKK